MTSGWIVTLVLGTQTITVVAVLLAFWIWSRYEEEEPVRTSWGRRFQPQDSTPVPPEMKDTEVR
jgi:hypothetical protein